MASTNISFTWLSSYWTLPLPWLVTSSSGCQSPSSLITSPIPIWYWARTRFLYNSLVCSLQLFHVLLFVLGHLLLSVPLQLLFYLEISPEWQWLMRTHRNSWCQNYENLLLMVFFHHSLYKVLKQYLNECLFLYFSLHHPQFQLIIDFFWARIQIYWTLFLLAPGDFLTTIWPGPPQLSSVFTPNPSSKI